MQRRSAISSVVVGMLLAGSFYSPRRTLSQELTSTISMEKIGTVWVRQLRFILILANPYAKPLQGQEVWLYLPVKHSATQDLVTVELGTTHEILSDTLGHSILKFTFPQFAPLAQRIIPVTVRLNVHAVPRQSSLLSLDDWLQAEKHTEVDDDAIVALAVKLKADTPTKTARNIYTWVSSNIAYQGYVADDLGALYALSERTGDCTEFAFLVVALARAARIPARMVGGYVTDKDLAPRSDEYHNWAELYLDGVWRIVDAQKMNWLIPCEQYIAFRYFKATSLSPIGLAHRYRIHGELTMHM